MQNKKSKEGRESLVKREQFLNKDVNRIFKYHKLTLKIPVLILSKIVRTIKKIQKMKNKCGPLLYKVQSSTN